MSSIGTHCLLEVYGCSPHLLDDSEYIVSALRNAAEHAGATWLDCASHRFHPQGVTAVGLLSESHISIHTWPEAGFAAADVFTCGDRAMPERACEWLIEALAPERHVIRRLDRGASDVARAAVPSEPMAPV